MVIDETKKLLGMVNHCLTKIPDSPGNQYFEWIHMVGENGTLSVKHVTDAAQSNIVLVAVGQGNLDAVAIDIVQIKKLLTGMSVKEPIEIELLKNKLKITQGTTIGKIPIHDPELVPDIEVVGTPDETVFITNGEYLRFMASNTVKGTTPVIRIIDDQQVTSAYALSKSLYYLREMETYSKEGGDITVPASCFHGWAGGTLIDKHEKYITIQRTEGDLQGLQMIVKPRLETIPDGYLAIVPIPEDPVMVPQKDFNEAIKKVIPSADAEDYIGIKTSKGQLILDVINQRKGSGIRSTCTATGSMEQLFFFASTLNTIVTRTTDTEVWIQIGDRGQVLFCGSEGTTGYVIKPSKIANI